MGYRSDVGFVIRVDTDCPNPEATFKELIGKIKLVGDEFFSGWEKECYGWGKQGSHYVFSFYTNDVKWYDAYPGVQAVDEILGMVKEIPYISWRFVRMGENEEDVEYQDHGEQAYDLHDYVHAVRYIQFDDSILGRQETDAQEQTEQAPAAQTETK